MTMSTDLAALAQPGLLQSPPAHARYLELRCRSGASADDLRAALRRLRPLVDGDAVVLGVGRSLLAGLGDGVAPPLRALLRDMPAWEGSAVPLPHTPLALWLWVRGSDPGEVVLRSLALRSVLEGMFVLAEVVSAFRHGDPAAAHGRDLTGYEDGTENPQGEAAVAAALDTSGPAGLRGGSCLAVQRWWHDMAAFSRMGSEAQDHAIGRRRRDNEELDDAPPSAHVQRTAQEQFSPQAFVVRRSMPWASPDDCGLYFVACGRDFAAFEAQMRRMVGADDGVVDALFAFTQPRSGAYLWCPPMHQGQLDLRSLGC